MTTDPPARYRHRRSRDRRDVVRGRIIGAAVLIVAGGVAVAAVVAEGTAPQPSGAHSSTSGSTPVAQRHPTTTTSSTPTTTTTAPPSTVTTSASSTVTISAVGDFNFGDTPTLPSDPSTYLDGVRSALQGQIVFGNLEGTLTDSGSTSKCAKKPGASTSSTTTTLTTPTTTSTTTPRQPSTSATTQNPVTCYAFRAPTSYASIIRAAGFTVINSANNHSHDYGAQGVAATSAALEGSGIVQAGLPGQIGLVTAGGLKVAFVDFAPYGVTNDLLDFATADALISQAKSEANLVVVYMHAGAEGESADHVTGKEEYYLGEDRGNPEAFAHAAIDDGADLVIASGPHTLRGMEDYKGHLIDYSLGDFASYEQFSTAGTLDLSGVLTVTLNDAGALVSGHFTSLVLSSVDQPSLDPHDAAAAFVNQLSSEDFGQYAVTIGSAGELSMQTGTASP